MIGRSRASREQARVAAIRDSGLFDTAWYLESYPDVAAAEGDPVLHYLQFGAAEGRFPNSLFDTRWYVKRYRQSFFRPKNPLLDFLRRAADGARDPNPYFSSAYYLYRNPDVAKAGINPLVHFVNFGASEGRDPSPSFSLKTYLELNPDVAREGHNPLAHFLHVGRHQGRAAPPVQGPVRDASPSRRWMDPRWALDQRESRRGRQIRLAAFAVGCAVHARGRGRQLGARASGHRLTGWAFLRFAVRRFQAHGLGSTSVSSSALLARPFRSEDQVNYTARVLAAPFPGLMLFTANGLKAEGFLADAEVICRDLARSGPLRDLALVALGDIYLTQAIWASEYQTYAAHGTAIDPDTILGLRHGPTWHDRTFEEAIGIIEQATIANPGNSDAWGLLAFAHRMGGHWTAAIEANERFAKLNPPSGEADLVRARALFGLNEAAGCRLFEHAIRGSRHRLSYGTARIVEDIGDVEPSRFLAVKPAVGPAAVALDYTLVSGGKRGSVRQIVDLPAEDLVEVADVQLLPEYGAVLVGDDTLLASMSHMRRCHDATFTSGLEAVANGHALYCTARPVPAPISVACFIGNNANYFHWLLEDLPRVEMLVEHQAYRHLPILVDRTILPWQVELLRRLGVNESRLCHVDFTRPVAARHLVLPPRLSKNLVVHPHAVAYLRDRLVPRARDLEPKPGKRLYLARKTALVQRGLINEAEVTERLRRAGFVSVDPGSLSIDEQISLFSDAEVIAAPGGAALSNILFAPSQTKILALSADAILSETFTSLAAALGQTYVLCAGPSYAHPDRQWIWTRFDFLIPKRDLEIGLADVMAKA